MPRIVLTDTQEVKHALGMNPFLGLRETPRIDKSIDPLRTQVCHMMDLLMLVQVQKLKQGLRRAKGRRFGDGDWNLAIEADADAQ